MKRGLSILVITFAIIVIAYHLFLKPLLPTLNGYAAKNFCSCLFIANIEEEQIRKEDLGFSPISLASLEVDYEAKSTSASLYGLVKKEAIYRPGLGCVLLNKVDRQQLANQHFSPSYDRIDSLINWFERIDTTDILTSTRQTKLNEVINRAFEEEDPEKQKNSRAVVVLYKGQLVGEQYADGISKNTPLLGWSMTKSLTSTMAGLLVRDEKWSLESNLPIQEWSQTDKEGITLKNALQMSTGLSFEEEYGTISDANTMLWESDSMGVYAQRLPLNHSPGDVWYYSSGTSNLIAAAMRTFFSSDKAYWNYLIKEVFNKIGAYSFIIEPDGSGAFVGSSFGWATARDWARMGQLYLNKGSWNAEQLLPKEWVEFVQEPAKDSNGTYGGHFWLSGRYPGIPEDAYFMSGFHGQMVMIIPSKEMVIVRLGLTYEGGDFDFTQFVNDLVASIHE